MAVKNIQERLDDAVALAEVTTEKFFNVLNGADDEVVSVDSGDVPTVAKTIKDIRDAISTGANDIITIATEAKDAAVEAKETILTDAGFVAVSTDLLNEDTIGTVAENISNVNIAATINQEISQVAAIDTEVVIVAENIEDIKKTAESITNVNTVGDNIANVNTTASVSQEITQVASVAESLQDIIDNMEDIQNASENADAALVASNIATTKAQEASASAEAARLSAEQASDGQIPGDMLQTDETAKDFVKNKAEWLQANVPTGLPLFYPMFFPNLQNDANWLRADTFSWQSGDVYPSAYSVLVNEYNEISETATDTFGEISITYKLTATKRKICDTTQEANIVALWEATSPRSSANYFIIDTENTQFKLPRYTSIEGLGSRSIDVGSFVPESLPTPTNLVNWHYHPNPEDPEAEMPVEVTDGGVTFEEGNHLALNHFYPDVYQKDAAVQQSSNVGYLYFFVGGKVANETIVNVGALTEQLNGKADAETVLGQINDLQAAVQTTVELKQDKEMPVIVSQNSVNLVDNAIHRISASSTCYLTLPEVTDHTKFHQIFVQFKRSATAGSVNLGTAYHFAGVGADFDETAGDYNIYYEHDGTKWWVAVMKKGLE